MKEYKTYYDSKDRQTTHVIKCRPEDIEVRLLGDTLHGSGLDGINGTFFDTPRPKLKESCWGLAVNDGKPIGPNAHVVSYKPVKRGVIAWDGKQMVCKSINHYKEVPGMLWGISGVLLTPYNRMAEQYAADIFRKCQHTIIGYDKDDNVYLIVRGSASMERLVQTCSKLELVGAVSLDGGGSSQLNFKGKGYESSRKINSAVIVRG